MKNSLPLRRPLPKTRLKTALHLEMLEERTLLDAGQFLYSPQAILRPDFGVHGKPNPSVSPIGPFVGPQGLGARTPPNVLVNDPGEDGNSRNDTQSETSLVVGSNNALISSYNDSFFANSSPSQYTGLSRSTDQGQSFADLGRLPVNPAGDAGDPSLAHDNVTGRSYLATLSFGAALHIWRSDDNFATYVGAPVNGAPGRNGLDKEWLTVDNASGTGQGNAYMVIRDFGSGNGIFLFRSTDQGATFGPNGGVTIVTAGGGNVQGAWVAVGPDHAVYASYYQSDDIGGANGRIVIRKSTDLGLTFGAPVTITTLQTVGINGDLHVGGFRSNAFAQVAVNPVNGQVYVVYNDKGTGSDRADVYFRQSNDGGATWSAATRVVDDTTGRDQWQPSLAVTPNGSKVGVFWYDRRNDPGNNLIDRYGDIGTVAGSTVAFGANFRISDTSFPPEFGHDPAINGVYMGDYDQSAATTSHFYTTWGDNRSMSHGHAGNNNDVRFASIPVDVAGPSVVAINPGGNAFAPVSTIRVTFDEEIDPTTATADQFFIQDQLGNQINVQDVSPVDGTNNFQFDVTIDTQTAGGIYYVQIGPNIADTAGHFMDQDGDGIPGNDPNDAFYGSFTIVGPSILRIARNGQPQDPPTSVRVTFNEPVDDTTFTLDQVASFTDPLGNPITVNSIALVDGSNNTQFDVFFDPQTTNGTYSITIGNNIQDFFGNPMTDFFTGTFLVTPVYAASALDFENLDIHGQPGTVRVIQYADDQSNPVSLGSHTFNYYGVTYTGNNQLFASSNALISFGTADPTFSNSDLTTSPTEGVIAPLWSDWIKNSGTDMLEANIDDANSRLILQWNAIQHFPNSPRGITFQVILQLDSGGLPGNIIFNYVDLNTGDGNSNGLTSAVGIKNTGPQGMDRVLVSRNQANPLIGSQKAILVSAQGAGPGPRGHGAPPAAFASAEALGLATALPPALPAHVPVPLEEKGPVAQLLSNPAVAGTFPADDAVVGSLASVRDRASTSHASATVAPRTGDGLDPWGLDQLRLDAWVG